MEMAPIVFVVILVHPQTVLRRGDLIGKGPALQKGERDVACSENSEIQSGWSIEFTTGSGRK